MTRLITPVRTIVNEQIDESPVPDPEDVDPERDDVDPGAD